MSLDILSSIPRNLRGRGHPKCVPFRCTDCGDDFLWEHQRGRSVTCPKCHVNYQIDDPAFDQTHNGQVV